METALAWTIDEALKDDNIHVVERNDELGAYAFTVGELQTLVTVQVSRLPSSHEAIYHLSHAIHTPAQIGPYRQSRGYWDDVPYALHQAISSITEHYRQAVEAGHEPQEAWLVRN